MGYHPGRQLLWHPYLWTCSRSCCPCCPYPLSRSPCCPSHLPRCPCSLPRSPRCPCFLPRSPRCPCPRSPWCRCCSRCSSLFPCCRSPNHHWLNISMEKNVKDLKYIFKLFIETLQIKFYIKIDSLIQIERRNK